MRGCVRLLPCVDIEKRLKDGFCLLSLSLSNFNKGLDGRASIELCRKPLALLGNCIFLGQRQRLPKEGGAIAALLGEQCSPAPGGRAVAATPVNRA
jgi:hypothetical protein